MRNLLVTPDGLICYLPIYDMIELLEYKLDALKKCRDEDGSWNYSIEELEEQIEKLKNISK